ncbi:DUF1772 domain-containing protein [Crossiella sp. SN42]|uniref:DUF1772 domain-containing protein n=1 Tax=Crossiella sp. SN42 TaxID=2944808 RepID=UPI00207C171C|nr:DUF1772 domain-containing protein [Crossiella sp. SN42]MCO1582701.1 DUF1772 domain-containing protein [Crossiella sp. SN42]
MDRARLACLVSIGYVWIAMIAFGGVLVETVLLYPNIFRDPPASLSESMGFFQVVGPGDVFRPLGMATVAAAVLAAITLWRRPRARWWILASLLVLALGEGLFSVLYLHPRNTIMFTEGLAVHSAEFLRQTAAEFVFGHYFRIAATALTAALAFTGMVRLLRTRPVA